MSPTRTAVAAIAEALPNEAMTFDEHRDLPGCNIVNSVQIAFHPRGHDSVDGTAAAGTPYDKREMRYRIKFRI